LSSKLFELSMCQKRIQGAQKVNVKYFSFCQLPCSVFVPPSSPISLQSRRISVRSKNFCTELAPHKKAPFHPPQVNINQSWNPMYVLVIMCRICCFSFFLCVLWTTLLMNMLCCKLRKLRISQFVHNHLLAPFHVLCLHLFVHI
jgi:hypothetical protein